VSLGSAGLGLVLGARGASRLRSQHGDNAAMWLQHRRWPCPASEACGQSKYLPGSLPAGKATEQRGLCHGGASGGEKKSTWKKTFSR